MPEPPERQGTSEEDTVRLDEWYGRIENASGSVGEVSEWLDQEHDERIREMQGMPERTLESVWWPFTQHGLVGCRRFAAHKLMLLR